MLLIRSRMADRIPHMILEPQVDGNHLQGWLSTLEITTPPGPASVMVAVPPGEEQSPLVHDLLAEGFVSTTRPLVAMFHPTLEHCSTATRDPDITIVQSERERNDANELLGRVFGLPAQVFDFYTPLGVVDTYILRVEQTIAAALCLCPFAGYAGIYSLAVTGSMRRRGYATRLLAQALSDAASAGFASAVLSCDRNLTGLYEAAGFSVCWELAAYWWDAWWR